MRPSLFDRLSYPPRPCSAIALHLAGEGPEAIAEGYPRVPLAHAYAILAYYHHDEPELDAYSKSRGDEADRLRHEIESTQDPPPSEFSSEKRRRWE